MITEAQGNLLASPVDALVNTVNTQGVMGKGIALQFKRAFPAMFRDYAAAAKRGEIVLGRMYVWPTQTLDGPKYVINFPTKGHWRNPSRLEDIKSGLNDLVRIIQELSISSIAVPPLGCGNGGLDWGQVEPLIHHAFADLPEVDVQLFAPVGTPKAADMLNNTPRPPMTAGRAALVGIIEDYMHQAQSEPSLIETQKLMYFLQVLGEPLKLQFAARHYGPYADNLRHVLNIVEGHYLTGFGDGTAKVTDAEVIKTVAGVYEHVTRELDKHPDTKARMEQVLKLADGYESAYGMELLATVHWLAASAPPGTTDEDIVLKVSDWSPRKSRMFTAPHVRSALETLRSHSLLATA